MGNGKKAITKLRKKKGEITSNKEPKIIKTLEEFSDVLYSIKHDTHPDN